MTSVVRCLLGALAGGAVGGGVSLVLFAYPVLQEGVSGPQSPLPAVLLLSAGGGLLGALVGLGISLIRISVERKEGL